MRGGDSFRPCHPPHRVVNLHTFHSLLLLTPHLPPSPLTVVNLRASAPTGCMKSNSAFRSTMPYPSGSQ